MFDFQQFMRFGGGAIATYSVQLRAYSAPFFQRHDEHRINELNYGGKILLPNSCLDNLMRRNIQYPMLFKLTNLTPVHQRVTHAGVLEFLAEEGHCYLPSWMMNQLHLVEGDHITVEYKVLPNATYAKFKPMSTDFYNISNPRAMLEVELRKFSCLTKGDVIAVQYNDQVYEFQVQDLRPENAVTIVECDINIEFDAAEGYVEPNRQPQNGENAAGEEEEQHHAPDMFKPFSGSGFRIDGKKAQTTAQQQDGPSASFSSSSVGRQSSSAGSTSSAPQREMFESIAADENYTPGELRFVRRPYKSKAQREKDAREKEDGEGGMKPFGGAGNAIRPTGGAQ